MASLLPGVSVGTRHSLTRTPLASVGQPANSPAASMTSEYTCAVDGSREASTTDAESADVREREDVKLMSVYANISTHLFSSTSTCRIPATLLLLLFALRNLARFRASGPVLKSVRRRWTKKRPPARGQMESEVVADVRVPSTGARSPSKRGGRTSGRIEEAAGSKATVSNVQACTHVLPV